MRSAVNREWNCTERAIHFVLAVLHQNKIPPGSKGISLERYPDHTLLKICQRDLDESTVSGNLSFFFFFFFRCLTSYQTDGNRDKFEYFGVVIHWLAFEASTNYIQYCHVPWPLIVEISATIIAFQVPFSERVYCDMKDQPLPWNIKQEIEGQDGCFIEHIVKSTNAKVLVGRSQCFPPITVARSVLNLACQFASRQFFSRAWPITA